MWQWFYRCGGIWVGYEDKVRCGYFENDIKIIIDGVGNECIFVQLKIIFKGIVRLVQIFGLIGSVV